MTRPKTSIEKLETRLGKVKDLKSALYVTRWKWKTVNEDMKKFWTLIDHHCGFCKLGNCEDCQTEVKKECKTIQKKTSKIEDELWELILSTRAFLGGLKY